MISSSVGRGAFFVFVSGIDGCYYTMWNVGARYEVSIFAPLSFRTFWMRSDCDCSGIFGLVISGFIASFNRAFIFFKCLGGTNSTFMEKLGPERKNSSHHIVRNLARSFNW